MTAPTPTPRVTPAGNMLEDGYQSLITFAADTNVDLWELEVTPPGLDGGDPIDDTTMHNTAYRTKEPQTLVEVGESTMVCGYSGDYDQYKALINVKTTITQKFPDGGTLAYYGYLKSFVPQSNSQGKLPQANVSIVATNKDTAGAEAGPVYTGSGE